ncbi:hypothetical protein J6590_066144 [Homalodisca vitripennis]|nr:hypothetical protein J6590_066144 [Homalodisca vitripennis]
MFLAVKRPKFHTVIKYLPWQKNNVATQLQFSNLYQITISGKPQAASMPVSIKQKTATKMDTSGLGGARQHQSDRSIHGAARALRVVSACALHGPAGCRCKQENYTSLLGGKSIGARGKPKKAREPSALSCQSGALITAN